MKAPGRRWPRQRWWGNVYLSQSDSCVSRCTGALFCSPTAPSCDRAGAVRGYWALGGLPVVHRKSGEVAMPLLLNWSGKSRTFSFLRKEIGLNTRELHGISRVLSDVEVERSKHCMQLKQPSAPSTLRPNAIPATCCMEVWSRLSPEHYVHCMLEGRSVANGSIYPEHRHASK